MNILLVKLSSLGDVVHAMPAVQDIRRVYPQARIDWVVEGGFAPLVRRCAGVDAVIETRQRQWRKRWWTAEVRAQRRAFVHTLQSRAYDAVIDLQGLTKSALVSAKARLAPGGQRWAMANRTEGSSYEWPTRWVADQAIVLPAHIDAVQRSRLLCARALDYPLVGKPTFGLQAACTANGNARHARPVVALVHGTSRDDKLWPLQHWLALGQRLMAQGYDLVLPQGNDAELARARQLAAALGPSAQVWPALDLGQVADALAGCAGVIGVDSGLSHIAVALDLPHVQIYNFDTAWRTGPSPEGRRQCSVFATAGPAVDSIWSAWLRVCAPGPQA